MRTPGDWSSQQLGEFLAAVSTFSTEAALLQGAVELAAEALDAELGAVVRDGRVLASVGFPRNAIPDRSLVDAASHPTATIDIPGFGQCALLLAPIESGTGGHILLARIEEGGFDRAEANLLRAMARSVALGARMLGLVDEERRLRLMSERQAEENARLLLELRERQQLLERLGNLRRSISLRAPLREVQEAIVDGARELIGDEVVGLRIVDPADRNYLLMPAHRGISADMAAALRRTPVGVGVGGRAVVEDRLVVVEDYHSESGMVAAFADSGLVAAMAAPVREEGRVVGSLTVATYRRGRRYSQNERDLLLALSEMANIALTDASMLASMRHLAFHDSLTGLANRALFIDRLEMSLARARRREGGGVGLLFIDVNDFKTLNDTLGHAVGDEVLAAVAEKLAEAQRETDTAARLGGDEFAILLDEITERSEAEAVAARICESLREPLLISGREVLVQASIGVAMSGGPQDDSHSLLRNADLAMYHAKQSAEKRPAWTVFEDRMYESFLARRDIEADLRRAVDNDELEIHYQPLVHLATGRLSGVEALLRWQHPVRGMVSPDTFISVAEETGLIIPVGHWALVHAVRQARAWQDAYPAHHAINVSVNLSARQMREPNLAEDVAAVLATEGLAPQHLTLEITETVLMQDTEATVQNLRGLREIGIRLAVDDFGTGYSSLGYLQRFPMDAIKIDRSFVRGITEEPEKSAVARTIINLGQVLNLATVAEGIETEAELAHLRQLECEFGQGFLFARPGPAESVERLIRKGLRASRPARSAERRVRAG